MAEPSIGIGNTLKQLPALGQNQQSSPGNGREVIDENAPERTSGPKVHPLAQWMSNAVANSGSAAKDNMIEGVGLAAGVSALGAARAWQQTGFKAGQFNIKGPLAVNAAKLFGPALVFSLVGPAAADGVTYLAPKAFPKYKKGMDTDQKMWTQVKRAGTAGAIGTAMGGVVFLVKPQWLNPIKMAVQGGMKMPPKSPPGVFPIEPIKKFSKAVLPVATLPAAYAAYDHADIADAFGNTIGRLTRNRF